MPGFQLEKENYNEAIVRDGIDKYGKVVKEHQWPRDPAPGESAYNKWVLNSADPETGKYYPQRDSNGDAIKGTGAHHIVDSIVRVRTKKGEFLYSLGGLKGFDYVGNPKPVSCARPEIWNKTSFKFERIIDANTGRITRQCLGPNGVEQEYLMPFNAKNLRESVSLRASDNIQFVLKDEISSGKNPQGLPITGSIETRVAFFLKDFDYLFNAEYLSKEDKAYNLKVSQLIRSGKAQDEQQALEMVELEAEANQPIRKQDTKSGVA